MVAIFDLFSFLVLTEVMNLEDMGSRIGSPSSCVNLSQGKLRNVLEIQKWFLAGWSREMEVRKSNANEDPAPS